MYQNDRIKKEDKENLEGNEKNSVSLSLQKVSEVCP